MSLRFTRRITIFPGVRLNFSKSGVSLSVGPRGSSVTFGKRGIFGNLGIPGTGLSYRKRLDSPSSSSREQTDPYDDGHDGAWTEFFDFETAWPSLEISLRNLLVTREQGVIDWHERALWLAEPAPDPDEDPDGFELYARRIGQARFAKRMVEGDRAAWEEVLREELYNEDLPFDFAFEWSIDEGTDRIRVGVELPPPELLEELELSVTKARELYEDVCCAILIRFAHEIFRVIPDANDVHLTGYRSGRSPATGKLVREIYLRLATDRDSFSHLELDHVDPSTSFEGLGGAKKTKRGELQPIDTEPHPDSVEGRIARLRADAAKMPVKLPCPCGHVIEGTLAEFRRDPHRECPGCGQELTANLSEAERQLRELEAEIRNAE